jgi:L-alanine-DL-glutamate epimerase-like enolase superfamily enzyme
VDDIARIGALVQARSRGILQAAHTFAGIDIAMWDLLGKRLGEPVWKLLGFKQAFPKLPYASSLFGDSPQETLAKARRVRVQGFRAAKFGWGPFGADTPAKDVDQLHAAREGLGPEGILLVDAGTIWVEDVGRAEKVLPALAEVRATWLEEPFVTSALQAYASLAQRSRTKIAGGEGSHNVYMAKQMIDEASIGFVQIDAGMVGITGSKEIADYARQRGVTYVNHTFTSNLALSASLQPFAGYRDAELCEYPVELKDLARAITVETILPAADGLIHLSDEPGLGVRVDPASWAHFIQDVEIRIGGTILYRTPPAI